LGWNAGSQSKAEKLADHMKRFIQRHTTYAGADLIVAVPPSNPNKPFDLPTYLVETITRSTKQTSATNYLKKVRNTRPMKDCSTRAEKIDNIKNAFAVSESAVSASFFEDKNVIIVDDIYETGCSLNEVSSVLKQAGAKLVLGLVATKTIRDLT